MILPSDPKANYLAHREEIDAAIGRVLESGRYILGEEVEAFEREFADWLGVSRAVGVANGTEALQLALHACGVAAGDGVVTVSHTAVATVAAVELAGATPILVDIEPRTFTMDCDSLEDALSREWPARPKAIVPVHLYGHPADMPRIMEIASRHGLRVIEDCSQSHGAAIGGRKAGSWGQAAVFSFYPTKNLGALGDGGMVVTNDSAVADRVRSLREYGWRERYVSAEPGLNSRLDELQAAVLRIKLRYLDAENEKRRELAAAYSVSMAAAPAVLPGSIAPAVHAWHQYVIRSAQRDALRDFLRKEDIGTLIHYPVPVHLQPAYRDRVLRVGLPRTEQVVHEILSLPMYPDLSLPEATRIGRLVLAAP